MIRCREPPSLITTTPPYPKMMREGGMAQTRGWRLFGASLAECDAALRAAAGAMRVAADLRILAAFILFLAFRCRLGLGSLSGCLVSAFLATIYSPSQPDPTEEK